MQSRKKMGEEREIEGGRERERERDRRGRGSGTLKEGNEGKNGIK